MDHFSFTVTVPKPSVRWLRFSLRTCLAFVVLLATAFSMYRIGFQAGLRSRFPVREHVTPVVALGGPVRPRELYSRVYNVADLVRQNGPFSMASLETTLTNSVLPDTWGVAGGEARIETFPTNLSLVISHDETGHQAIGKHLATVRREIQLLVR